MYTFLCTIDQTVQATIPNAISEVEPTHWLSGYTRLNAHLLQHTHTIPVDAGDTR